MTGDRPYLPIPGLIDLIPTPSTKRYSNLTTETTATNNLNENTDTLNSSGSETNNLFHDPQSVYQKKIKSHYTATQKFSSEASGKSSVPFPDLPFVKASDVLEGRIDPGYSRRSFLTLVATGESTILCYAKNIEGRSQVPCAYTIAVVGKSLLQCNITKKYSIVLKNEICCYNF